MGEEWWCGFLRQTMACGQTGGRKGSSSPYRKVVVIRRWSPSGRQWKQSKWWLVVPLVPWGGAVTALFLADILGMRGGISSSESIWEVVVGGPSGDPSQRSTSSGGGGGGGPFPFGFFGGGWGNLLLGALWGARGKNLPRPPPPKAPEGPLTTIVTAVTVSSQIDSDNKPPPLYDRETKTLSFPQFPLKISFDAEIYTTTPHPSSTSVAPTTFISDTDRVTKTTNKTAGSIPDINLVKRKLEYEREEAWKKVSACPPLPIRRLRHRMMLSYGATTRENKLYYHLLPDGVISAFAANGTANGRHGYVQPAMKAVNTMLREMEDGNPDPIALNTNITKILPIRDPLTSRAKKVSFANHAKKNGCNVLCLRLQRYK